MSSSFSRALSVGHTGFKALELFGHSGEIKPAGLLILGLSVLGLLASEASTNVGTWTGLSDGRRS